MMILLYFHMVSIWDPWIFHILLGPQSGSAPKWLRKAASPMSGIWVRRIPPVWDRHGQIHCLSVFVFLCFCSSFCLLCSLSFLVRCFWFLLLLLLSLLFFLLFLLLFFFFLVADGRVSCPSPVFMGHVCHCERDGTGVIGPEKTTAMFHQVCGSVWRWGTPQSPVANINWWNNVQTNLNILRYEN